MNKQHCEIISFYLILISSTYSNRCSGLLLQYITMIHTHTHSLGLLWTRNRPVAETFTRKYVRHSLKTDIHAPDGTRIHNSSKREAAKPRIRPHGHRNRLKYMMCGFMHEFIGTWVYCSLANCVFCIALYAFFDVKAEDCQIMLLVSI
jgi:hypothetical protein